MTNPLDAGSPTHMMLLIQSLDPHASLLLSKWTRKWYVSARIEISDGVMLRGGAKHRDTPVEAIYAYLEWLIDVPSDEMLVTRASYDDRRYWRWNGAAFAEEQPSFT